MRWAIAALFALIFVVQVDNVLGDSHRKALRWGMLVFVALHAAATWYTWWQAFVSTP